MGHEHSINQNNPKTTTKEQKKQEVKTLLTEVKENTLTAKIRLGTMSMRATVYGSRVSVGSCTG